MYKALVEKNCFCFWVEIFPSINFMVLHPLSQTFGLSKGISVRSKLGLILMKKDFNSFNFYGIEIHEIF